MNEEELNIVKKDIPKRLKLTPNKLISILSHHLYFI